MELMQGRSLARVLREGGPMEPARAVRIVGQVLDSLAEAHSVGVLHRDLKPDNVMVLQGLGAEDFVKVLDFGIAKLQGAGGTSLTAAGMAFGTPSYMSPEQAQAKEVDPRSDLYSVGVILFELLAGKLPFDGDTPMALMLKKLQGKAPTVYHVNPDVRIPAGLQDALDSLLAGDAELWPKDATAAKTMLAGVTASARDVPVGSVVVEGGTTKVVPVQTEAPTELRRADDVVPTPWRHGPAKAGRRGTWLLVAAAAVAALAVVLAAVLAGGGDPSGPAAPAAVTTPTTSASAPDPARAVPPQAAVVPAATPPAAASRSGASAIPPRPVARPASRGAGVPPTRKAAEPAKTGDTDDDVAGMLKRAGSQDDITLKRPGGH